MKLYFLRHGPAAPRDSTAYPDDSARPLTPEGEKKTHRIARGVAALGISADALLSSPYSRALRTAEIAAGALNLKSKLALAEDLSPGGNSKRLVHLLHADYGSAQTIMLVGHEPGMSELISVLLTGKRELPLELKKGGLCRLRVEAELKYGRCAVLESLLTPKQLIQAGKR